MFVTDLRICLCGVFTEQLVTRIVETFPLTPTHFKKYTSTAIMTGLRYVIFIKTTPIAQFK